MRCKTARLRLDPYRTGELAERDAAALSAHLATCADCRRSLDAIRGLARVAPALRDAAPGPSDSLLADSFDRVEHAGETVWIAFRAEGLRLILSGVSYEGFEEEYWRRYRRPLLAAPLPAPLRRQVSSALDGIATERPRVAWSERTTPFERAVLSLLPQIPRGEVRTYEWLARKAGRPRAVRAVGNILARNAVPIVVPCHRVVPTAGGVGSYVFGSAMKRDLLRREGVDLDMLERLTREGIRYIGSRTTKIACVPTCRDARRIREENRVPFKRSDEAARAGFRPCMHCEPFAA